jgi:phosphatidylinositol-3-phosphatase
MRMPLDPERTAQPEQCTGCGAVLVEDQRYCLQCGARHGKPRLDFVAFWGPLSPTNGPGERSSAQAGGTTAGQPHSWWASASFLGAGAPSRGLAATLAAGVLAVGILAGVALGPGPASSPADSATLAQRALAALVERAGRDSQAAPSTSATAATAPPPITSEPTPTPGTTSNTNSKAKSAPNPSEASGTSESSGESTTSGSSEGSSKSSKGSGESEKTAPGTPIKLPAIKHVWVITLSGTSFNAALADPTADPYLAKQLVPKGTLLSNYALSSSSSLGNGIALLSGQNVNLDTEQNCPTYSALEPPTVNATTGLAEGVGCVYPAAVKTLADELTAGSLTWKAYVQDMEEGAPANGTAPTAGAQSGTSATQGASAPSGTSRPAGTPSAPQADSSLSGTSATPGTQSQPTAAVTCRRPEPGTPDPNNTPAPGDPYLTYRNPFVYFASLLNEGACASNDVDLSQLQASLATPANTPSLSWIVPSACNDGSAAPCAPGSAAGLAPLDAFLKEVVPQILATSAYAKEGLIVIVPDSPPASPGAASKPVGALLLSPFVRSGARVTESFNDFSLSKSISLLFGVLPLGHANNQATVSFGATVYGASGKAASAASTAKKAAQAASTQPRRRPLPDLAGPGTPASHPGG